MKTFFIISNQLKRPCREVALELKKYLEEKGKVCYVQFEEDRRLDGQVHMEGRQVVYKHTDPSRIPQDVECVLVLGGDGTLLQAARDLVGRSLPMLGINMGTLGYLAGIESETAREALDRLMEGAYLTEERMMLTGCARRGEEVLLQDLALNDIVIARRGHLRVVDFNIYVDGSFLCSYRADGIILATATGSTGYSLSAGGPIVAPTARLMLLTAIAPHTLNSRTVVLPDDVEVAVEIAGDQHSDTDGAQVVFDGDTCVDLQRGDRIHIRRSESRTTLIKLQQTSFVQILRRKMN